MMCSWEFSCCKPKKVLITLTQGFLRIGNRNRLNQEITTKSRLVQDVSFLLGEPCHDNAESHPEEVMNFEEAVQKENHEDCNTQQWTQHHGSLVRFPGQSFDKRWTCFHSRALQDGIYWSNAFLQRPINSRVFLSRSRSRKIDKNFRSFTSPCTVLTCVD